MPIIVTKVDAETTISLSQKTQIVQTKIKMSVTRLLEESTSRWIMTLDLGRLYASHMLL